MALAVLAAAAQEGDFDPLSKDWNGLHRLVELARGLPGVHVSVVPRLDWPADPTRTAVLLVYPRGDLGAGAARRYVEAGGRLVVADDFGHGDGLLRAFGLARAPVPVDGTERLGGLSALPVARPVGDHPLVRGVARIVTNHPTGLLGEGVRVATFPGTDVHLAVERRLGHGRLLAVSDGSVLINNMLELPDNLRFAGNLLRWALPEDGGRLVIAAGTREAAVRALPSRRWRFRLDLLDRDLLWLVGLAMFGCALLVLLGLVPGSRETAWRGGGPPAERGRPAPFAHRFERLANVPERGDGRLLAALVGQRARILLGRGRVTEHAAVTFSRYADRHPLLPGGLAGLASVIQEVEETPPSADPYSAGFRRWTLREALYLYGRVRELAAARRP